MGTPESAVPSLQKCLEDGHEVVSVWTQPDRPAGRGRKMHAPPVKEFALANGLVVHQPAKLKTDASFDLFSHAAADAAVVVAYGRILPHAYLLAPRHGCVNVHFSLLPKYRGAAPVNWAIARGERETGVTTMQIDEELDTGAIYLQRSTAIGERETAPELLARLAEEGAELLSETLARLQELEPRKQDDGQATYAPVLKREDGLIDWSLRAEEIERRVRGFQPWPLAHTSYKGKHLVVWQARPATLERSPPPPSSRSHQSQTSTSKEAQLSSSSVAAGDARAPGEVTDAKGDDLLVRCGDASALLLQEVQMEGKRRMSARDFINGMHVRAGERLG